MFLLKKIFNENASLSTVVTLKRKPFILPDFTPSTRGILQLPEIRDLLPDPGNDLDTVPVTFLKALEAKHAGLEVVLDKNVGYLVGL